MTAALEEAKIIDVEEWLTLATSPSPTKLKIGQTPDAKNVWVDEKPGSVITAPGYLKVGTIPSNNPVTFCINYFKSSAGTQTFVVSDNSTVWTTVDFQTFTSIITGLSSAFQLRGAVIRDKLWLTNGSDAVRNYDGTTVTVLDGTAGTPNVPKGRFIAYHDERIWLGHLPSARSEAQFSALTDSSGTIIAPDNANAWPAANTLQISEGDADYLSGMFVYRGYLHFFKQYSIWRLVGYDEYTYTRVKTRASSGCRFNESIQILDNLIHMIGIDGIYVFDGDETERISDIIDPATASQTAFGFNQLQQQNTNNVFWEVTDTADWNSGTVPTNVTIDNDLELVAADDSQADFAAGATLTNIDTSFSPGTIQLTVSSSGVAAENIATGAACSITPVTNTSLIGSATSLTDGDLTTQCGLSAGGATGNGIFQINLSSSRNITTIILRQVNANFAQLVVRADNVDQTPSALTGGLTHSGSTIFFPANSGYRDFTLTFPAFTVTSDIKLVVNAILSSNAFTMAECEIYIAAYNSTGKFTSKTLDLGLTPAAYGNFSATEILNGETTAYFTQSSADGSSWDAEVSCTNGGAIGSTVRRYLRWGVNFTSDGNHSPVVQEAFLPAVYQSAIHDTGGSIFSWGPFESDRTLPLQCNFYYRAATTSGGVSAASWNLIVPGGVVNTSTSNRYIQFKIEILNGDSTHLPVVTSVTINWVTGTGTQLTTLQNVASVAWRNRYWMAAAGPSATANDTVLVRGKKTFGSPWQLKDFPLLSFTRFYDSLYAGSSNDGSIYQIDTGHSKNGTAIDSYFETGDFTFGGFYINPKEILVEVERKGPYNLYVGLSIDRGNTWVDYAVDLTTSSYAPSYTKRINVGTYNTDRIRFRVRTNGVDEPFEVHRLIFYYNIEAARGSIK